jgi:hypothetical protein
LVICWRQQITKSTNNQINNPSYHRPAYPQNRPFLLPVEKNEYFFSECPALRRVKLDADRADIAGLNGRFGVLRGRATAVGTHQIDAHRLWGVISELKVENNRFPGRYFAEIVFGRGKPSDAAFRIRFPGQGA